MFRQTPATAPRVSCRLHRTTHRIVQSIISPLLLKGRRSWRKTTHAASLNTPIHHHHHHHRKNNNNNNNKITAEALTFAYRQIGSSCYNITIELATRTTASYTSQSSFRNRKSNHETLAAAARTRATKHPLTTNIESTHPTLAHTHHRI